MNNVLHRVFARTGTYSSDRIARIAHRSLSPASVVLSIFTLLYVAPTLIIASQKLLWDDEFYTLYLSTAGGWREILRALATGADQHPPAFYFLTHSVLHLAGTTPISLRLPAIVGFWLMCVCLYWIARTLTNPAWAAVALLLPLTTEGYRYASEARGYGLMFGCSAAAVLAWTRATAGLNRRVFLPLLAASLAAAVSSHYYAVLVLAPLCGGELVRSIARRRVDVPVWAAFAAAGVPLLLFLGTIRSARGYSAYFWARPLLQDLLSYYTKMLSYLVDVAFAAIVLIVLLRLCGSRFAFSGAGLASPCSLRVWQATALGIFTALPLIVFTVAKLVTNAYVERYALPALLGVVAILACCLYNFSGGSNWAALAVCIASLVCFWFNWSALLRTELGFHASLTEDLKMLRAIDKEPVVISEISLFHRLSFYAPRSVASRFTYVASPAMSFEHLGHDTLERGFLDLRPWFPLNVVPFDSYERTHRRFFSYGYIGRWSWLTYELSQAPFETILIARSGHRVLWFTTNRSSEKLPGVADTVTKVPRLYDTLAVTEPTLCEHYMGRGACPVFR